MALRPMLAQMMTSSWRPEFPAATALAVAVVIGLVSRIRSSAVAFFSGKVPASYDYERKHQTVQCLLMKEKKHKLGNKPLDFSQITPG